MILNPQKGKAKKEQVALAEIQESVNPYQHEMNITEGSEFLDDAIRTKDQPLQETDSNTLKPDALYNVP